MSLFEVLRCGGELGGCWHQGSLSTSYLVMCLAGGVVVQVSTTWVVSAAPGRTWFIPQVVPSQPPADDLQSVLSTSQRRVLIYSHIPHHDCFPAHQHTQPSGTDRQKCLIQQGSSQVTSDHPRWPLTSKPGSSPSLPPRSLFCVHADDWWMHVHACLVTMATPSWLSGDNCTLALSDVRTNLQNTRL